jgi:hypothetical protein
MFRRGLSTEWTAKNPVLANGEPGFEIDTKKCKIGDGMTSWNTLPYLTSYSGGGIPTNLADHVNDPLPHPVYDDGPSFLLLYENAKV